MPRFLVDAEISFGDGPRFVTSFVVVMPNEDVAENAAQDYLTEGSWWDEYGTLEDELAQAVIVHDLAMRQLSAEGIARAITEIRYSRPRKRGAPHLRLRQPQVQT